MKNIIKYSKDKSNCNVMMNYKILRKSINKIKYKIIKNNFQYHYNKYNLLNMIDYFN